MFAGNGFNATSSSNLSLILTRFGIQHVMSLSSDAPPPIVLERLFLDDDDNSDGLALLVIGLDNRETLQSLVSKVSVVKS
jgi:hypothetical protein